jgi:hypothetical protein
VWVSCTWVAVKNGRQSGLVGCSAFLSFLSIECFLFFMTKEEDERHAGVCFDV